MRDSADSDDYGVTRRGRKRGKFDYDEPAAFFLTRDAENIGRWFAAHGLTGVRPDPASLPALLRREALLDP